MKCRLNQDIILNIITNNNYNKFSKKGDCKDMFSPIYMGDSAPHIQ